MKKLILVILMMLVSFAAFAESIGNIKKFTGDVFILRGEGKLNAEPGMKIYESDKIKTGENSSVGLIFSDSTVFSIGPSSEVELKKYVFEPKNKQYGFDMYMSKGTGVFTTGRMGKLSPESVKIHTPKATVGIRGTKFLIRVE